jgi:hypothetical protein
MRFVYETLAKRFDFQEHDIIHLFWGPNREYEVDIRAYLEDGQVMGRATGSVLGMREVSPEVKDQLIAAKNAVSLPMAYMGDFVPRTETDEGIELEYTRSAGPWFHLPEPLRTVLAEIEGTYSTVLREVFDAFRWRTGDIFTERDAFLDVREVIWSEDGVEWTRIKPALAFDSGGWRELGVKRYALDFLDQARSQGWRSPLSHELLREGYEHRKQNPRSAVVLAVAAAEIGVKHFIADLVPHATFIIERIQSPPLDELLAHYVHTLPVRNTFDGRVVPLPRDVRKTIVAGAQSRNKIVHRPQDARDVTAQLTPDYVTNLFLAVADLLWLLDYYSGHSWARRYIRKSTLERMPSGSK